MLSGAADIEKPIQNSIGSGNIVILATERSGGKDNVKEIP